MTAADKGRMLYIVEQVYRDALYSICAMRWAEEFGTDCSREILEEATFLCWQNFTNRLQWLLRQGDFDGLDKQSAINLIDDELNIEVNRLIRRGEFA